MDSAPTFRFESGDVLLSLQLTMANDGGSLPPGNGAAPPGPHDRARQVVNSSPELFVDPATGAGTPRALRRDVATEVRWSRGLDASPSVVGLRVEPCAELRERGEGEAADAVLRAVAEIIPFLVRARDRVYRTGPDELGLLMPGTGEEGKEAALRRLIAGVPGAIADRQLGPVRLVPRRISPRELAAIR